MGRRSFTIAAGVAAFVVFVVAMIPAQQLAARLPEGISLRGIEGTVWSGSARMLVAEGFEFGPVGWSCRPWALLRLGWSCRVDLAPPGGELSGNLSGRLGADEILARSLAGQVPIVMLEGLAVPRGWSGRLELDISELRMVSRRPVAAAGTVHLRGLRAPGAGGQALGDFELTIGEGSVGTGALTGRLRDLGGPLRVRGVVELRPDGSYLVNGEAAPGPGAGHAIFDTLAFLGPPDRQGRRPFTIEGTL